MHERKHWNDMPDDHIRFVWWLGTGTGVTAPAIRGRDEILICWPDSTSSTIIHEFGHHFMGRDHHTNSGNIMFGEAAGAFSRNLEIWQAREYSGLD